MNNAVLILSNQKTNLIEDAVALNINFKCDIEPQLLRLSRSIDMVEEEDIDVEVDVDAMENISEFMNERRTSMEVDNYKDSVSVQATTEADVLRCQRLWWSLTRLLCLNIEEALWSSIEDTFVKIRQYYRLVTPTELSHWLTMLKLVAASYGHVRVTHAHWEKVRKLESLRLDTIYQSDDNYPTDDVSRSRTSSAVSSPDSVWGIGH